jgi:hypothetical protein
MQYWLMKLHIELFLVRWFSSDKSNDLDDFFLYSGPTNVANLGFFTFKFTLAKFFEIYSTKFSEVIDLQNSRTLKKRSGKFSETKKIRKLKAQNLAKR